MRERKVVASRAQTEAPAQGEGSDHVPNERSNVAKKTLPVRVTLPASIEEAIAALNGIESLLTAKGWERAAIVYAFVCASPGPGKPIEHHCGNVSSDICYSPERFTDLEVNGLESHNTVTIYHDIWKTEGTKKDLRPGDTVTLPTIDFPRTRPDSAEGRLSVDPKKALVQILKREKDRPGYLFELFDLMEEEVDSTRLTVDPTPVSMAGSSITSDVTQHFVGAARHIEKAVARLNDAITHGTRFESEEFETLAHEPEWRLDPELLVYRKTVAMVVTHEVEV